MTLSSRITTGAMLGVLAALAETIALLTVDGARAIVGAGVGLGLLYATLGGAAGLVLGVLESSLRAAGWWPSWQSLTRRDPVRAGTAFAALACAGVGVFVLQRAALALGTRLHDPALLAWAVTVCALAMLAGTVVMVAALRAPFAALLRRVPRLASPGAALAVALLGALCVYVVALWARPALLSWPARIGLPTAALLYIALSHALDRRPKLSRATLALPGLAALAAIGLGGPARGTLERDSWGGAVAVRLLQTWTDLDGDGHSAVFGGGDCDDLDASRFPGARDVAHDCVEASVVAAERDALGDGGLVTLPPNAAPRPNVILVTVDALRPDHLGCFGYARDTSPRLDAFCAESIRFRRAIAPSSRSIRSLPAMHTGLYPTQLRFGGQFQWPDLEPSQTTMAERLRDAGYRTAAFVGTRYFERAPGLFQGFDHVTHAEDWKAADGEVLEQALPALSGGEPFFVWLHLFHTHTPYLDDGAPSRFGDDEVGRYDTEVARADRRIGQLLDALRARGLDERTVVAVASDHGEAFGEHGHHGHSHSLYAEETLATLLVRAPGFAPREVSTPVGLHDLAPTLLNLAGTAPTWPMVGRSLVAHMRGAPPDSSRVLFSELLPDGMVTTDQRAAWTSDGWVLLRWLRDNRTELYAIDDDPRQREDLSFAHPDVRARLEGRIAAHEHVGDPSNRRRDVLAAHRVERLPPDARRLDRAVPGVGVLRGWRVSPAEVRPGEDLTVELYFEADGTGEAHLFHLGFAGPPGFRLPWRFGADYTPLSGHYPTSEWRAGELLRDRVVIPVPHAPYPARLQLTFRTSHPDRGATPAIRLGALRVAADG